MNWREVLGNPNASAGDIVRQACPWLVEEGRIAEYLREQYQYDRWAEEEYKLYVLQDFDRLGEDDDSHELDEQDFAQFAKQVLDEWYEELAHEMLDMIYGSDKVETNKIREIIDWLGKSELSGRGNVSILVDMWMKYKEMEEEGK